MKPEVALQVLEISGSSYYTAAQVARALGVSRQTIWRWRTEGKIPLGHRFRDRKILFSTAEFTAVQEYANRLEPADRTPTKPESTLRHDDK